LVELFNNKRLVIGGPEIQKTEVVNNIQYIVGEGEYPLFEYLMGYKPIEQPLDQRPPVMPDDDVFNNPDTRMNFETQRGCNYRCSYCDYHKDYKGVRYRNPMVVVDEIYYCWQRGKTIGRIVDPNFFSNSEHAYKILNGLIDKGVKFRLVFEAIPKYLTEKLVDIIAAYIRSGGELVIVQGVQSLNKQTLRAVNRPSGNETESIDALTKTGATLKIDGILGLPFETKESYEELLEYICRKMVLGPHHYPGINVLQPIEGTKLCKDIDKFGIVVRDGFVYQTSTMSRQDILDGIRMNAVVFRIFGPLCPDIRKQYTEKMPPNHIAVIKKIVNHLLEKMPADSQFVNPTDPEFYYKDTKREVPGNLILEAL
jgi:hypothetical protein